MRVGRVLLLAVVLSAQALAVAAAEEDAAPPSPASPSSSPSASESISSVPPFLATVTVASPGARPDTVAFGIDLDATDGYDVGRDRPEPPPPPNGTYLSAYVVAPQGRLARSVLAVADERAWTLRVDASGAAGDVTLTFSGLEGIPWHHVVEATAANATREVVNGDTIAFVKADGLSSYRIEVRLRPLGGGPPGIPANFSARATDWPGEVDLAWNASPDDGGHPVRGYILYRLEGDERVELARLAGRTFRDAERPLGESRYEVVAWNRAGIGAPAAARVEVVGVPSDLTPDRHARNGSQVTAGEQGSPGQNASVAPMRIDAVDISATRRPSNPNYLEVRARAAGEELPVLEVYTFRESPVEHEGGPVDTPGARLDVPGASVAYEAVAAESAASPTGRQLTLRFVVEGHATSVGVAWLP